jgi:hypothetical protein
MRQSFEAAHGRHQHHVLFPDGRRAFEISKPVTHKITLETHNKGRPQDGTRWRDVSQPNTVYE